MSAAADRGHGQNPRGEVHHVEVRGVIAERAEVSRGPRGGCREHGGGAHHAIQLQRPPLVDEPLHEELPLGLCVRVS